MGRVAQGQTQLIPQSIDAEQAVLGACLIDPDAILRLAELSLRPDEFYTVAHRYIWQAIRDLSRKGGVDHIVVSQLLRERQDGSADQLAAIGGEVALIKLIERTAATGTANVLHYAGLVRQTAKRRAIISFAGDIARQAHAHEGDIHELLDSVQRGLLELVDTGSTETHLQGGEAALFDLIGRMEALRDRLENDPHALIQMGINGIDSVIGDLPAGFFTLLGAYPGVGKTMLMEQIAEHNARHGHKVVFYHLELLHDTMLFRSIARWGGDPPVRIKDLRRGVWNQQADDAYAELKQWQHNITFAMVDGWSAERIAADIRLQVARGNCELAIVDYLQMIPLPGGSKNAAMQIGDQTKALKDSATHCKIPVVLGTQLNRKAKSEGRRPDMNDIRNSGEPGEGANIIILLDRETPRDEQVDGEPEVLSFYIDKNTQGDYAEGKLAHIKGRYLVADLETRADPAPHWGDF